MDAKLIKWTDAIVPVKKDGCLQQASQLYININIYYNYEVQL